MTPLLAQAAPDAAALKTWFEVFFYVIGGITAVVLLYRQFRPAQSEIVGQPLEFKAHPGSVTREELKQVHGRIERERREIDEQIKRVEMVAEKRSERIEGKLDHNTHMTSEMKGELTHINSTMHQLTSAVQNFLRDAAQRK